MSCAEARSLIHNEIGCRNSEIDWRFPRGRRKKITGRYSKSASRDVRSAMKRRKHAKSEEPTVEATGLISGR